jgi:hypothetical protein
MTLVTTLRELNRQKVGTAIEELHHSENDLVRELVSLSDRHRSDHEIFHVARDIAGWSEEHLRRLARAGRDYGLDLEPEPPHGLSLVSRAKQKGAELAARRHEPSLVLLDGLRHLHQTAAGVSLDWEVLAQTAQAVQDEELLALTQACHPQTLRQLRWANAMVKEISAQVMVAP